MREGGERRGEKRGERQAEENGEETGEEKGGEERRKEERRDVGGVPGQAEGLDRMPCWPMAADLLSLAHQTAFDTNETWLLCP